MKEVEDKVKKKEKKNDFSTNSIRFVFGSPFTYSQNEFQKALNVDIVVAF